MLPTSSIFDAFLVGAVGERVFDLPTNSTTVSRSASGQIAASSIPWADRSIELGQWTVDPAEPRLSLRESRC
jgi:hypothetical protein